MSSKSKDLEQKIWWRLLKIIYVFAYGFLLLITIFAIFLQYSSYNSALDWNKRSKTENENLKRVMENPNVITWLDKIKQGNYNYTAYDLKKKLEEYSNLELPYELKYSEIKKVEFMSYIKDFFIFTFWLWVISTIVIEGIRRILLYIVGINNSKSLWTKIDESDKQ